MCYFFNFFSWSLLAFLIVWIPILFQKYKIFGLDLISYAYPIPKHYPGFENFIRADSSTGLGKIVKFIFVSLSEIIKPTDIVVVAIAVHPFASEAVTV